MIPEDVFLILKLKYCILIVINCLTTPKFDPFKKCEVVLRCIFITWSLYLAPADYIFCFVSTVMNGLYIGMEITGVAAKVFFSLWTVFPWLITAFYANVFNLPLQRRDMIQIVCAAMAIHIFVVITATLNKKARLEALYKLEQAYSELRELNAKNEEMNKELKQLLEDKDNFILLFSHETRNPLNILLGNLNLLLEEVDSPHSRTKLLRSKFCAELLLHHLNNILDTGKLSNKKSLEVTSVKMRTREYLQTAWDFMEMLLKKKGLKPEFLVSKSVPRFLYLDPQRLTQILLNLISNSAKFTSSGSVSLTVDYLSKSQLTDADFMPATVFGHKLIQPKSETSDIGDEFLEFSKKTQSVYFRQFQREIIPSLNTSIVEESYRQERGYLKFEITDTGCGIREEDLEKLFKKFTQVHSEGSARQIGTGLGLWISKNLATLMGGDIRVYSKPDVGTCFVVIIGTRTSPSVIATHRGENLLTSSTNRKEKQQKMILLADDDPYNLDLHKQLLKNAGWENLVTATNGKQLVDIFEAHKPGTIYGVITDASMPLLDGISAAKVIREIENKRGTKNKVKIGFITGHSNVADKITCEKSPINAWFYASKPVTAAILEGYLQPKSVLLDHETNYTKREEKYVVLCVDDDLFNLEMLEGMLKEFNTIVLKAQSGRQALQVVESEMERQGRIDLVLIDCHMPGMDGWVTSQRIKEMTQKNALYDGMLIVGLSGDRIIGYEKKLKESGIEDWIQKPVHREDLLCMFEKLDDRISFG